MSTLKPTGSPDINVLKHPLPAARGFGVITPSKSTASFLFTLGWRLPNRRSVPKLNITSPSPSKRHGTLPWVFGPYLMVKSCPSHGAAEPIKAIEVSSSSLAPVAVLVQATSESEEGILEPVLSFKPGLPCMHWWLRSPCVKCYRSSPCIF